MHLRRHDSQQPVLLQHHRVAGRKLQLCASKRGGKLCTAAAGTYHAAIYQTNGEVMASQLDADDKQQTLDWAAARQAWDQHVEALDTDAGERADGVTALESKLGTRAHWDGVYERELRNFAHDPSDEGVDWFSDDVGDRLMEYVTETALWRTVSSTSAAARPCSSWIWRRSGKDASWASTTRKWPSRSRPTSGRSGD